MYDYNYMYIIAGAIATTVGLLMIMSLSYHLSSKSRGQTTQVGNIDQTITTVVPQPPAEIPAEELLENAAKAALEEHARESTRTAAAQEAFYLPMV